MHIVFRGARLKALIHLICRLCRMCDLGWLRVYVQYVCCEIMAAIAYRYRDHFNDGLVFCTKKRHKETECISVG